MKRTGLILIALLIIASQGISQIIYVPGDQPSIQAGIDDAVDGDTVLVKDSTYFENINFKRKAITVASHFLIDGDTSHISKTIINGSQPVDPDTASVVRMISGEDSTSVLCGFTITGGKGMYIDASLCLIYPLSTVYIDGGGIIIIDGGATIKNNIITNNIIEQREGRVCGGGGIDVIISESDRSNEKTLLIENNIISDNQLHGGESGGAGIRMFIDSSNTESGMDIFVQGNTITANRIAVTATSKKGVVGAGMLIGFRIPIRNGDYLIRNNSICNNRIESSPMPAFAEGGGMYVFYLESGDNSNCAPKIYNNIISDNYSPNLGGGIGVYSWGDRSYNISPSIFNNTIINNQSPISPGLDLARVKTLVVNNIFSNQGNDSEFRINSSTALLYNNAIRGSEDLNQGNINVLPIFEEDSYELAEGSPGIGAGIPSVEVEGVIFEAPETDFYGFPRPGPVDRWVDMGAIESPFERLVNIPDAAFLNALIEAGVDNSGDGEISYPEAEAVHILEISGKSISSLTGIEAFMNLDTLDCANNELTDVNITGNPGLMMLNCSNNQLEELDISMHTGLLNLDCGGNQISNLGFSYNTDLKFLSCGNNLLENLDIANNAQIETLLLNELPSLSEVCVWTEFNTDNIEVNITGSENICFQEDCNGDCTIVGIRGYDMSGISLYPNPVKHVLTIETLTPGKYAIELYSMNGQLIHSQTSIGSLYKLDLKNISKGIYIVTVRSDAWVSTEKVVKL